MKKITIILPVYNEENILKETLKELEKFIKNKKNWEVIFVDDGSKDRSLEILENYKPKFFKIISYSKNKGKGYAIKQGILEAKGEYIGFTDSDLAYSFENLERALRHLDDFDIVIGSRKLVEGYLKNLSLQRKIFGKGFSIIANLLLGHEIPDSQSGLKAFRNNVAEDIFEKQTLNGFSFDAEILYIARKKKYSVKQIPAYVSPNHKQKKSKVNLLMDPAKMFLDLIKIRKNSRLGKYD